MLREADVVLALFDSRLRVGTAVEVGYAAALGKRMAALLRHDEHFAGRPHAENPNDHADAQSAWMYAEVFGTNHGCTCQGWDSGYFWFPMHLCAEFQIYHDASEIGARGAQVLARLLVLPREAGRWPA
jgi:hypothetical protein